jgi:hypothetical protein
VQAAVEGNLRAIEADDLVVREKDLVRDLLEDPGRLPLFATAPNGRVGDLGAAKTLGVLPAATRHQMHEHHLEGEPVALASPMPAEGVVVDRTRNQRFKPLQDSFLYLPGPVRA